MQTGRMVTIDQVLFTVVRTWPARDLFVPSTWTRTNRSRVVDSKQNFVILASKNTPVGVNFAGKVYMKLVCCPRAAMLKVHPGARIGNVSIYQQYSCLKRQWLFISLKTTMKRFPAGNAIIPTLSRHQGEVTEYKWVTTYIQHTL